MGFCSANSSQAAVERLTRECANIIPPPPTSPPPPPSSQESSEQEDNLWGLLDSHVGTQRGSNATASAIAEVQRYLKDPHLPRSEDPLKYWERHHLVFPHVSQIAMRYLCTPASSVPCERVFSKAGEVVSSRQNRLQHR
ncbi:zinc finger BED domain-containing protein 4-like [Perca flavescens]|uniref:zinc finger BED domain-containing protein 4-like n=1 Tax=Perca flavescens TaxID=8167 RepID=UPI00106EEB17|nr:zinc finger BED domain-containing protein 4-like [Perca flavescens]